VTLSPSDSEVSRPAEEAHVLVVDVHVDEAVQVALVGDQAPLRPAVPAVQVVEQRGERAPEPCTAFSPPV
jgi:hypothetical protein